MIVQKIYRQKRTADLKRRIPVGFRVVETHVTRGFARPSVGADVSAVYDQRVAESTSQVGLHFDLHEPQHRAYAFRAYKLTIFIINDCTQCGSPTKYITALSN